MSKFTATVIEIQSEQELHILTFKHNEIVLKMMSLELFENLILGATVVLSCKATSVAIAKNLQGELSYSNQIKMQITSIQSGKLLSNLQLQSNELVLESIITTSSVTRMNLQENDEVIALIKSSDLFVMDVL